MSGPRPNLPQEYSGRGPLLPEKGDEHCGLHRDIASQSGDLDDPWRKDSDPEIAHRFRIFLRESRINRIHRKGHRNKSLSERERRRNKTRSQVRARIERVFEVRRNDTGGMPLTAVWGLGSDMPPVGGKVGSGPCPADRAASVPLVVNPICRG